MKIGRPSLLTPEQIEEIRVELEKPYWGQLEALSIKYNVKASTIRKIKSRMLKSI